METLMLRDAAPVVSSQAAFAVVDAYDGSCRSSSRLRILAHVFFGASDIHE